MSLLLKQSNQYQDLHALHPPLSQTFTIPGLRIPEENKTSPPSLQSPYNVKYTYLNMNGQSARLVRNDSLELSIPIL